MSWLSYSKELIVTSQIVEVWRKEGSLVEKDHCSEYDKRGWVPSIVHRY